MSAVHEALYGVALNAIQRLFGDTSVGQEETLKSLNGLKSEINMSIDAIEEDLRKERRG